MDNAPDQTGYNTEMKIVARMEINDVITTKPHYRRVQRNIPNKFREFIMIWEADICS